MSLSGFIVFPVSSNMRQAPGLCTDVQGAEQSDTFSLWVILLHSRLGTEGSHYFMQMRMSRL